MLELLLPIGIMVGMMYFLLIRPQKQQQEKVQNMLDNLEVGDSVVTIGGLHGIIDEIDPAEGIVVLNSEGIYLVFERRSIARVVSKGTEIDSVVEEPEIIDSEDIEE